MQKDFDKFAGILLGLAVGDALGTTLEFGKRIPLNNLHTEIVGGGVFNLNPGEWTDDTAMAVALGHSLIVKKAFSPTSVLDEWVNWYIHGKHSCTGTCFDIGSSTSDALDKYIKNPGIVPTINPQALGNGSLMRLAPIVLFSSDMNNAEALSFEQASLTHGRVAADITGIFGKLLFRVATKGFDLSMIPSGIRNMKRDEVSSSGYVKDTIEAALWAIANTSTFEDAVIQAVNLGDDADTVGAVTGQLAGAIYGLSNIPDRWLQVLEWRDYLLQMTKELLLHD